MRIFADILTRTNEAICIIVRIINQNRLCHKKLIFTSF